MAESICRSTGSPQTVADILQRWFSERALDGANIHIGHPAQFRRFTGEVVPILRERRIVRAEYEAGTLCGNLGLPVPENRYTRARQQVPGESDGLVADLRDRGRLVP